MCWASQTSVGESATAIADARQHVLAHLTATSPDLSDSETLWDVELMVSEMVTNAVQARAETIAVTTVVHWNHLRVDVIDDARGRPTPRTASAAENSGRGLAILAAVSDEWGVAERAVGKSVWVLMQLPVGTHTPPGCRLQPIAD